MLSVQKDILAKPSTEITKDIEEWKMEVCELTKLYRDKKVPYKLLRDRIKEIFLYIKEDIREQLHS